MDQQHQQAQQSGLSAALEFEGGAVAQAQVTNFEGDTIELAFSLAEAPLLAIAQLVVLRLRLGPSSPELRIPVWVIARSDDEVQRKYKLQPRRKHELAGLKRSHQRAHVRVRPRAEAPIQVELCDHTGKRLAAGSALDISVAGVGVLLESSDEQALISHDRLELVMQLPDGLPPRTVQGLIRSRRLVGASICIGIRFEPERTQTFRDAEQSFTRYVMQRLDEMANGERRVDLNGPSGDTGA